MNPQKTQAQYLYKSPGMVCPQYTNMHYHRTEKSEGVWGQFIFKIFSNALCSRDSMVHILSFDK